MASAPVNKCVIAARQETLWKARTGQLSPVNPSTTRDDKEERGGCGGWSTPMPMIKQHVCSGLVYVVS